MTEWISVKDRLPENKFPFLGTDGELIFACYWNEYTNRYVVGGWQDCYYCGGQSDVSFFKEKYSSRLITYWIPVPELPKE